MFVIASMNNEAENMLSLKSDPEVFEELIEREGIIPAPYMARNKWISVQKNCRIRQAELKELIRISYELVIAKLPKKTQNSIINS